MISPFRLGAKQQPEQAPPTWVPRPQAPPTEQEQPMEVEEEMLPQSVSDARRAFEVPEEGIPPSRAPPVQKPGPKMPPKMPQQKPSKRKAPVKPGSPPRLLSIFVCMLKTSSIFIHFSSSGL